MESPWHTLSDLKLRSYRLGQFQLDPHSLRSTEPLSSSSLRVPRIPMPYSEKTTRHSTIKWRRQPVELPMALQLSLTKEQRMEDERGLHCQHNMQVLISGRLRSSVIDSSCTLECGKAKETSHWNVLLPSIDMLLSPCRQRPSMLFINYPTRTAALVICLTPSNVMMPVYRLRWPI